MRKNILLFVWLSLFATALRAQDLSLYQREMFATSQGDSMPYRVLYPENFNPEERYPLVLFLHGRGESGRDNEKQLTYGARLFLKDTLRTNYPAIVVFPQCPTDSYWSNVLIQTDNTGKRNFTFMKGGDPTPAMRALLELTGSLTDKPYVDKDRVYVGGLSMGGMGTYELLRRKPKLFAAAFAICGGDHVANVKKYRKVPLWVFHGAKDNVVPLAFSESVVQALRRKGAKVNFTVYPNADHNSWDAAFAEPALLPWLFIHSKP
jgi:predicted peptidase